MKDDIDEGCREARALVERSGAGRDPVNTPPRELPRTFKVVTIWMLVGTLVFLGTPVVALALSSQVVGQGLLVFALNNWDRWSNAASLDNRWGLSQPLPETSASRPAGQASPRLVGMATESSRA